MILLVLSLVSARASLGSSVHLGIDGRWSEGHSLRLADFDLHIILQRLNLRCSLTGVDCACVLLGLVFRNQDLGSFVQVVVLAAHILYYILFKGVLLKACLLM